MTAGWAFNPDNPLCHIDPLALKEQLWPGKPYVDAAGENRPGCYFYNKQREIIYAVEDSVETYVKAGNKLGKDYVAGFLCLSNFLRAIKCGVSCRIVTTSVAEHHLKVLWAEIARFIRECRVPLLAKDGGPLVINHLEIRRKDEMAMKNPGSYLVGRVSKAGEGLAGHHAEYTLGVADEASGCSPVAYDMFQGWAKRQLWFGNPNSVAPTHPFRKGCESGDLLSTA